MDFEDKTISESQHDFMDFCISNLKDSSREIKRYKHNHGYLNIQWLKYIFLFL